MSEDADESSKTEDATTRKLEKAHEQGQFAMSQEVQLWLSLGATLIIFLTLLPGLVSDLMLRLTRYVEEVDSAPMDRGSIGHLLMRVMMDILTALWLPVLLLMVAGVVSTLLQKGWSVAWAVITPKFSKLNPIAGLQRMFSPAQQSVELAKGLAKIGVVGVVAYVALLPMVRAIEHFVGIELLLMLLEMEDLVGRLLIGVFVTVMIIAAADLIWQRYTYNKKMKMTKQEVKEEHKQADGDPQVKARIRQLRFERARKRMMAAVPTADVVVTNPTHFAVALKYDAMSMGAPMVVAKGADTLALKIREVATENKVPIVENPPLARALYATVEIDQEVPSEHYRAVAEVITYVMKLKKRSPRG
ncbi:flagellar biosynthesis protein FlhB [Azospirillum sp. RWY-5-1]|uniref:Flagellar biosynthetic protein FlhB n=1 Tax=Azospirillum oleiclasticum TaxID=2735135 RepID=A0ABX2T834_9PROT|nr:flagellar biosynthesis protein FlhB [Azospirillum oleiclasticum]NYZ11669.1 flagellar biosynthesis protein FlhB [Azospirillum oleiclasticum]NYZ18830.1 flagellar biosynthesis protein FlhB [Azospirillum oleiclasticum]